MERNSMWRRNRQKATTKTTRRQRQSGLHTKFQLIIFSFFSFSSSQFSYPHTFLVIHFIFSSSPFPTAECRLAGSQLTAERRKKYHPTTRIVGTIACVQCVKIFSSNIRLWLSCAHHDRLATAMSFSLCREEFALINFYHFLMSDVMCWTQTCSGRGKCARIALFLFSSQLR